MFRIKSLKSEAVLDARYLLSGAHFNVASDDDQYSERRVRDKRKDVLTDFFSRRAAIKFLPKTNARWMPLIRNDLNAESVTGRETPSLCMLTRKRNVRAYAATAPRIAHADSGI
jgi:hypothetical protein